MVFEMEKLECVSYSHAKKLKKEFGIVNADDFLSYENKEEIKKRLNLDDYTLDQWCSVTSLLTIPKITMRDAELLFYCNINSPEELAHRESSRIFYKLKEIDEKTFLIILQYPTFREIDEWIYYAKMMIIPIKYGLGIPMILLPGITLEIASRLASFNIFTVGDFLYRKDFIRGLRTRVLRYSRDQYRALMRFINILRIDGVDVKLAKAMTASGFDSIESVKSASPETLFSKLSEYAEKSGGLDEEIDEQYIKEIIANAERLEVIK